jgi:hypothetical protein
LNAACTAAILAAREAAASGHRRKEHDLDLAGLLSDLP